MHFFIGHRQLAKYNQPQFAYKLYKNFIRNEIVHIKSAHNVRFHDKVAIIPVLKILGVNLYHKFYMFDCSINNAVIDINKKHLITPSFTLLIVCDKKTLLRKKYFPCNFSI